MATRKRRNPAAGTAAVIRRRWKRTGHSVVQQRNPYEEPALSMHTRKAPAGGLLDFTGTPDKSEYYHKLGYPRFSPAAVRRGVSNPLANGGTTVAYVVQPGDTLTRIADAFQISVEALRMANPELGPQDTIFVGQVLSIPLSDPSFPPEPRTLIPFVVQMGQSLSTIALMFGINVADLRRVNPHIGADDAIFVGQVVWIPLVPDAPASQLPAILYVVQPGDTLGAIGLRFGVSRQDMVQANPQIADPDRIFPGEIIVVPVSGVPEQPIYRLRRYVVQPGDSILTIAARFQVTLNSLQNANPLLLAIPGLTLVIPQGVAIPAPPDPVPGSRPCRRPPFGRSLELGDDDFAFVPFGSEFTFPFYGQRYNGLFVNSNGNVTFGSGDANFFASVDLFIEGPPRIAPFWVDLNPPGGVVGSGVFVDIERSTNPTEARVVVTWDRTPYFFTEIPNTFQLSLYADGLIQICYFSVADPPDPRRILIGVARGQGRPESNIFRYDGTENPRRTGEPQEPTPSGSLTGRILQYVFDDAVGNYRLEFME